MTRALAAIRALNMAKLERFVAGTPSLTEEEQAAIIAREVGLADWNEVQEILRSLILWAESASMRIEKDRDSINWRELENARTFYKRTYTP